VIIRTVAWVSLPSVANTSNQRTDGALPLSKGVIRKALRSGQLSSASQCQEWRRWVTVKAVTNLLGVGWGGAGRQRTDKSRGC